MTDPTIIRDSAKPALSSKFLEAMKDAAWGAPDEYRQTLLLLCLEAASDIERRLLESMLAMFEDAAVAPVIVAQR